MKGKIIAILVMMLLIAAAVLPVAGLTNIKNVSGTRSNEGNDWWPMFHHDLQHSGYSTSNAPDRNNVLWIYTTGGPVGSSPAVYDDKVYIGSSDYNVYCLDADDGSKVWSYPTGNLVYSCPVVADGMVFVGSYDNKVYALNETTGALVWSYTTGHWVISSPVVADGKVFVGSADNKVYALDEFTGALIWSYTTGNDVLSSPAVADGMVFVGSDDYKVYALDEFTGALVWSYTTGLYAESSPAVADGKVFVGSMDNKVYAFGNNPPNAPTITGPISGKPGTSYTYTFNSTDPDGDDISEYIINWGDGPNETITGPFTSGTPQAKSYTWTSQGTYTIKAKAKYIYGAEGPEGSLMVKIPRNKAIHNPFLNYLENHPNMFPILRQLLSL